MPTARETTINKPLSGNEYKQIILNDFKRLLDNEGLLSPHIAFGRVSHRIILAIHVDNPMVPQSTIETHSVPKRDLEGNLGPEETPPLQNPSPEAEIGAMELSRDITSPNAERLRNDMPVPARVKQQDGTTTEEQIKYPPGSFPELGAGEVMLKDVTEATKAMWKPVEPESQGGAK